MTHLVIDGCINCKYTDCVAVCPVDCFHEGPNFLVINPDECIDCAVCIPECPANAIIAEDDLSEDERKKWYDINADLAAKWPSIAKQKDPLPNADEWKNVPNKITHLQK